jgi:HK97 family phage major capsid protein
MMASLQAMLQERSGLRVEGSKLLGKKEADRSDAEIERLEALTRRVSELNDSIEREEFARAGLSGDAGLAGGAGASSNASIRAMADYIRTGNAGGLQRIQFEAAYNNTDMNIGTPADGGYAVPTGLFKSIIARRDETLLANQLGVRRIPGKGLTVRVPIDNEDDLLFTAVSEANSVGQDAPALYYKDMTLAKYAKYITLSVELLRDEDAQLMAFVNDWIGRGWAATHNQALLTEVLAHGTAALTLDAAAAIGASEIPELVGKLAPEYQEGAQWIMAPGTVATIQGLSGTPFYFAPGANGYAGKPALWSYPVNQSSYASAIGASAKSLIFGNFGYAGLREGTGLTMLRDPYTAAATGQVRLWFWFDMVYGVLQSEAIVYATHPSA